MKGGFMSDVVYTEVMDHTIVACADAVIVDRSQKIFYLAKRISLPWRGVWCIGGRRRKGETPLESVKHNFQRETGLELAEERFSFVTITEYIFQERAQEPRNKGSHTTCHQFWVELTSGELERVERGLDKEEYEQEFGLQKYDRQRLVEEEVCPPILLFYDLIFPQV